uniref:Ig-like domain-containing protein n=1 Tax=Dendroctonus ponderosae TaxID=77166 RepID=A0AAR5PYC7_DENPD
MPSSQITATTSNITLVCKVLGEPTPDIEWINNGHIVERDPRKNKQKYSNAKSRTPEYTWNNLTIINLSYKDRGDYKCIAKNPGGEDEKAITLLIDSEVYLSGTTASFGGSPVLIISLSVGLIVLLIIILILVCLFCRRAKSRTMQSKRNDLDSSSEECISMRGHAEIKKSIMTDVNPICKPPRSSVPASVVSGGTEVSDAKRNLLDNESVFDLDDETRSFDFDQPLPQKSNNALLESDYRPHQNQYPPDLLTFPARTQISPAPSNASTIMMDRLPPTHGLQSPMHNPIYDQLSIYKTLPYSRSHSPFTLGIPRFPRQGVGYVTIPRRPRQSWSSEQPPNSEVIGEPLYDNC